MGRRIAAAGIVLLTACGGAAYRSDTATTVPPTVAPTTTPAPTLPAGVGPLCADTIAALGREIAALGGTVHQKDLGDTPFARALHSSLEDCSTRIEWLTA